MSRSVLPDALRSWRSARLGKREITLRADGSVRLSERITFDHFTADFPDFEAADRAVRNGQIDWRKSLTPNQQRAARRG